MPTMPPTFRPRGSRSKVERDREHDVRRHDQASRSLDSWTWRKARAAHLATHPLCVMCLRAGVIEPATILDHIVAHKGDARLFWNPLNWQSLCKCHHDREKQRDERGLSAEARERRMPSGLMPCNIPLVIVCGPAGAGKSSYVEANAGPNDVVIDLDIVMADLSRGSIHQAKTGWLEAGLDERNRRLRALASDREHDRAWFVIAAPDSRQRREWATRLGAERVHIVTTPLEECQRRIKSDPSRAGRAGEQMAEWAMEWWRIYEITLPLV